MRKRKRMWLLATVGAALVAGGMDASADVIIDLFDAPTSGQWVIANNLSGGAPVSSSSSSANNLSNVWGGQRDLYVNTGDYQTMVGISTGGGLLIEFNEPDPGLALNANPAATVAYALWDGDGSQPMNFDFLAEDVDRFYLASNGGGTQREADREILLTLWNGNVSEAVSWTLIDDQVDHYLNFNAFSLIDFTSISAIRMDFITDDISISQFVAKPGPSVPEPVPVPGAAALGLFGMGLVVARRRKQNASA